MFNGTFENLFLNYFRNSNKICQIIYFPNNSEAQKRFFEVGVTV